MLSVLMTSYNREKFISESIESVLSQDFTDYEFIIVDDASEDSTWDIVRFYQSKDKRIKSFRNQCNIGDYPNRNIAASYANRKYIKFVDSDDLLMVGALSQMVNSMEANPNCSIGLIGKGLNLPKNCTLVLKPKSSYRKIFFQGKIVTVGPSFSILNREKFRKLGGFPLRGALSDLDLWLQMIALGDICLFDESLVYWRRHSNQEFELAEKTHFNLYNAYHIYLEALLYKNCPLPPEEIKYAIQNLKNRYSRKIIKQALMLNFKASCLLAKETTLNFYDLVKSLQKNKYPEGAKLL
jgi:glycosyltransferase involved in cell wall biosynthesis